MEEILGEIVDAGYLDYISLGIIIMIVLAAAHSLYCTYKLEKDCNV